MAVFAPGDIAYLGNIFGRGMVFGEPGDVINEHEHTFDHTTFVLHGSIRAICQPKDQGEVDAVVYSYESAMRQGIVDTDVDHDQAAKDFFGHPDVGFVTILRNCPHKLIALEKNTVAMCVYARRDPDGVVINDFARGMIQHPGSFG